MFDINLVVFTFVYKLLGPDSFVSGVTIFFAEWFPYLVVASALVYEMFIRDDGNTLRSLFRIYTPPVIVVAVTEIFKLFFASPRPFAAPDMDFIITPLISVNDPFGSFPSSHTAFFAALAVTMYFCNPKIGKLFLIGTVLIGIARIGAGVHWPIDIVSGFFFGILLGWVIETISLKIWKDKAPQC